jgi:CDP-glucose 4,6-dehydratase
LATRPWQHVLDCLSGYLWLGSRLAQAGKDSPLASAFNFGPGPQANWPVSALVDQIVRIWPGQWERADQTPAMAPHEAEQLNLAIDKAASLLEWFPTWGVKEAIERTLGWYHRRHMLAKDDMVQFSLGQIGEYMAAAQDRNAAWTRSTTA